jgi:hypothetical protein
MVTQDQYQSADSLQIYEEQGLNCGKQSIDRKDDPYLAWMSLLMDECMRHYYSEVLEQEAFAAIHNRRKRKVDHPSGGEVNINVLQSFVGALFNLVNADLQSVEVGDVDIRSNRDTKKKEGKEVLQSMMGQTSYTDNPIGTMNRMRQHKDFINSIMG